MNGIRLGMYDNLKNHVAALMVGRSRYLSNALTSGLTGWVGGFLGSPFNLIKTRLMLQSPFLSSGDRYAYKGFIDAVRAIS